MRKKIVANLIIILMIVLILTNNIQVVIKMSSYFIHPNLQFNLLFITVFIQKSLNIFQIYFTLLTSLTESLNCTKTYSEILMKNFI